jgi:signal transduction histidine kinase
VSRIVSIPRRYRFDLLIGLLLVAAMLEVVIGRNSPDGSAPHTSLWFALPAIGILIVPILARRVFPLSPAAHWVLASAISFVDWKLVTFPISLFVVGLAAAFLVGNLRDPVQAAFGLAFIIGGSVTVVYKIPGHSAAQLVFIPLEFAISWVAGFALRERAEQAAAAEERAIHAERERDAAARVAVAEERVRIARELHDIVAHAVSVMVLQVGAVRHKLPGELEEDRDALTNVEQAGRTALTEMRRLLAAMRHEGDEAEFAPQPGLDALNSLLEDVERAGLPVTLQIDGDPFPLPPAIDLSAYRIVQEGLTNSLKHARASAADVLVRYSPDELQLEVRDNGEGGSGSDRPGHGLVGIGERVKIYGGTMSAGSTNGSGFVLTTRLPLGRQRP